MKIAIIGSGISGNMAAYILNPHHDITLFEKRDRPGGHSATVDVTFNDGHEIAVDTGFIVYNDLNYPGLIKLFAELDVQTQASDMSFCFSQDKGALEWSGQSLKTIFAQKSNLLRPKFWRMLLDILRFNKEARRVHEANNLGELSLKQWLDLNAYSDAFRTQYLFPMAASIWSMPLEDIGDFPAASLIQFFYNHRLIDRDRPKWRTVSGGSRHYVHKLISGFAQSIKYNANIEQIWRSDNGVIVKEGGVEHKFDKIIFATHSDQALSLLADPTPQEQALLGAVKYAPNDVYLHSDKDLMPKRSTVWSSWNYMNEGNDNKAVFVSYWMNLLQNIPMKYPLFVSLNPSKAPAKDKTHFHAVYDHPQFDAGAIAAQSTIADRQGENNTYFCGAWLGYGFHEDGLQSAVRVCKLIGVEWSDTRIDEVIAAQ
ncbi:NAD(P)-binding protein [Alphaproteobacteria bacterium]|nr:NAD(P)-binding protein [Alphaproteobacteria bacterium]